MVASNLERAYLGVVMATQFVFRLIVVGLSLTVLVGFSLMILVSGIRAGSWLLITGGVVASSLMGYCLHGVFLASYSTLVDRRKGWNFLREGNLKSSFVYFHKELVRSHFTGGAAATLQFYNCIDAISKIYSSVEIVYSFDELLIARKNLMINEKFLKRQVSASMNYKTGLKSKIVEDGAKEVLASLRGQCRKILFSMPDLENLIQAEISVDETNDPKLQWGKNGRCPTCGFSYRWDGLKCAHCGHENSV